MGEGEPQPLLEVEAERNGRVALVVARGEIDVSSVEPLRRTLDEAVESGMPAVLLDLSEVEFIDSTGARTIILAHAALAGQGREMAVVAPPGAVRRVFALLKLDDTIPTADSRDAARALLRT